MRTVDAIVRALLGGRWWVGTPCARPQTERERSTHDTRSRTRAKRDLLKSANSEIEVTKFED